MRHEFVESKEFPEEMSFGDLIKKVRRLAGLNQTDMGVEFGMCQRRLSDYENGKFSPKLENALYMLRRMGLEIKIEPVRDSCKVRQIEETYELLNDDLSVYIV